MNWPKFITLSIALAATFIPLRAESILVNSWDFSKAAANGEEIVVPDAVSQNPLRFKSGAKIIDDLDAPGGKALEFTGTQAEPGSTQRAMDPMESIQIKLRFKPSDEGGPLQTIVSLNAAYELRCNREKGMIEFIVSYPEKKYVSVKAEVSVGVWNQAVATLKDGKLTLTVGLARKEGSLPPGVSIAPKKTFAQITTNKPSSRPFSGAIAELTVGGAP